MAKFLTVMGIVFAHVFFAEAQAADCSGIPVSMPQVAWCDFLTRFPFTDQNDTRRKVSQRVREAMGLSDVPDTQIRSYAFAVLVSKYSFASAGSPELVALAKEQQDILDFLQEQGFDEAVILKDDEATPEVIRKFFTEYYVPQLSSGFASGQKIRCMFLFDGHGWQPPTPESTGALALSSLQDQSDRDYDHRFSLAELRGLLQDLAPYTQSMVALLNSCYSGSVFSGKPIAEDFLPGQGAWIATAVPGTQEAWVFKKEGSVFFQDLIQTIRKWRPGGGDLPSADSASIVNFGEFTPKCPSENSLSLWNHL